MLNDIGVFLILVIGGYDAWLILAGEETISCRFQRYFPMWVDIVILVALVIVIYILPVYSAIKLVLGVIAGHIFWPNRERFNG